MLWGYAPQQRSWQKTAPPEFKPGPGDRPGTVKTEDGREMVEALVIELERREVGPADLTPEIMAELRAALGLGQRFRGPLDKSPG